MQNSIEKTWEYLITFSQWSMSARSTLGSQQTFEVMFLRVDASLLIGGPINDDLPEVRQYSSSNQTLTLPAIIGALGLWGTSTSTSNSKLFSSIRAARSLGLIANSIYSSSIALTTCEIANKKREQETCFRLRPGLRTGPRWESSWRYPWPSSRLRRDTSPILHPIDAASQSCPVGSCAFAPNPDDAMQPDVNSWTSRRRF